MRTAVLAAVALGGVALSGCVIERRKAVPTYDEPLFARSEGEADSPFRRERERIAGPATRDAEAVPTAGPPRVVAAEPAAFERPARTVTGTYAGHRPLPPGATLEDRARERFLAHETTIVAREATVYVPERYAREASLRGAAVEEDGAGRRTALGDASLALRRLSVRAAKVSLVSRSTPDEVQVTARGDVSFRSDQPASLLEEQGLRALLLRNDAHTPLR